MFSVNLAGVVALSFAIPGVAAAQDEPNTIIVTLPKSRDVRSFGVAAQCPFYPVSDDSSQQASHPGDDLRKRLGLTVPKASFLVIVHRYAAHHTAQQWSVVAWRNADARWTVQRGGEAGGGLLQQPRVVWESQSWALPLEAGKALDELLINASTFEEPALGEEAYVGSLDSTMEIITPAGRRTVCWSGTLMGSLGAIAEHIMEPR